MGFIYAFIGTFLVLIGVSRYFPEAELSKQLARLGDALAVFIGPIIFAAGGILARHTSDHGRWLKTSGKEGNKMDWKVVGRDMVAAPLWAMIAGTIVEWGFNGPFYATLAVAGTAGYLAPFLTDIVVDGVKKLIQAAVDRVRGGPPAGGGNGEAG